MFRLCNDILVLFKKTFACPEQCGSAGHHPTKLKVTPVQFLVRAHASVADLVPSEGRV